MSQRHGLRGVIARAGAASLLVKVSAAGFTYLVHILLARVMGTEAYGDYIYVLAWVTLLGLFCTVGLDTAALRFLPAYIAAESWSAARGFLHRASQVVGLTSVAGVGLYIGGVLVAKNSLDTSLAEAFLFAAPLLLVNAFLALSGRILQALRRVVLAEAPNKILRPILLGLSVLALHLFRPDPPSAIAVLVLNAVTATVALVVMLALIRRLFPREARDATPQYRTREWMSVGLPLLLLAGLHMVIARTDLLMVGAFLGTTEAGIYAVGARTAELTGFGLMAVNMIAAPLIAQHHAEGDSRGLQQTVTLAARGSSVVALLIAAVLVIGGAWILGLFGSEFRGAYTTLVLLVVGQLVSAFVGSVGYLMTMTGHEREVAVVVGLAALLNLLLNLLLIPRYGLNGAATATAASLVSWNFVLAWRVVRRLRVVPSAIGPIRDSGENP